MSDAELAAFRARHAFWVGGWEAYAERGARGERSAGSGARCARSAERGGDGRSAADRAVADQVRFDREWAALRGYAAERGVHLIGDVPIYVAPGSADQAAWPELFLAGQQAGVPPDAFSDDGQLWGNPLYDWPALRRRGYGWWAERLRRTFELFDVARVDHFRAFVAAWAVPAGAPDARGGRWRRGPGRAVFDAAGAALGHDLPLIAEDLGVITPPVTALRRSLGLPGMVVLQFAFDPDDPRGPHRPENHAEDSVVYTGTHDSDTLGGWWASLPRARRAEAIAAGARADEPEWSLIELAWASPARLAMLQVQDVLELGSEARMNVPGTLGRSWRWQMEPGALTAGHAERLREITHAAGRLATGGAPL